MNWLDELLEPFLDRLAQKLALKVRAELDGAIDAALDRADDRIGTALERLEKRLLAAAAKPIADLKAAVEPDLALQQQLQAACKADGVTPAKSAKAAGMISAEESRKQMDAALDEAMDQLRSRLTPPRPWVPKPWKEIPDR